MIANLLQIATIAGSAAVTVYRGWQRWIHDRPQPDAQQILRGIMTELETRLDGIGGYNGLPRNDDLCVLGTELAALRTLLETALTSMELTEGERGEILRLQRRNAQYIGRLEAFLGRT